jgi:APA family basic amino acid/polyamine antiporter
MPANSSIFGLLVCAIWLLYFYGANLTSGWFGLFNFDSSELPVITIYAMYIPMIIMWIVKEKELNVFKRYILPIASIIACAFLVFVAVMTHGVNPYIDGQAKGQFTFPVLFYLIIFAIVMIIGFFFSPAFKNRKK